MTNSNEVAGSTNSIGMEEPGLRPLKKKKWSRPSAKFIRSLRDRLCEMQRYRCAYCLADIRTKATLEHVWPHSKRGPTNYHNCVAACESCNLERGNGQLWDQYWRVRDVRRARKAGVMA